MDECQIIWNTLSLKEWEERFNSLRRSNLLQCYPYAQAYCSHHHQRARWGLIIIDGQEAGLVQVFEAGIFGNALHALSLDRGPLWFEGAGTQAQIIAFFAAFDRQFPKRFGRRRRIIPEVSADDSLLIPMAADGRAQPYQTIWLDLDGDEETLRAGLEKKWRNALSKAERSDLRVEWDHEGKALDWLLLHHEFHRQKGRYRAASPKFIRLMARYFVPRGEMLIARAFAGQEPVAGILLFCHGRSATYQMGWSGDQGRHTNAHHFLLWQALLKLKARGIRDFDLGGINEEAEGVRQFKEGLGGEIVRLSGIYR